MRFDQTLLSIACSAILGAVGILSYVALEEPIIVYAVDLQFEPIPIEMHDPEPVADLYQEIVEEVEEEQEESIIDTYQLPEGYEETFTRTKHEDILTECPLDEEEEIALEIQEGEYELLTQLVHAEAGNQDLIGKQYVADVVLNRVASSDWPNTIHEVIFQKGQFSVAHNGALDKAAWNLTDEDFEAVRLETDGSQLDTEIIYFQTRRYNTWGEPAFQYGDHYFSKSRKK